MADTLEVACLQTRPMPDFAQALDEALTMGAAAVEAGAKMLFLPEYCGGLKSDGKVLIPPSEPEAMHPFLAGIREFARTSGVWVNIGSIAVDGPDGKIVNRGFMIDADGEIHGRYDKVHLFDVNVTETEVYRESATVSPGDAAVIHDTPMARIGHTICYDLRFPDLFRNLAQAGAQIICCPAAFTKRTGEAHWHILNRARAIENTCFMVSACAIGPVPGGGASYGHSLVVSPWGDVLADGGTLPGVVHAQIDLTKVAATAARIPSLSNGRSFKKASPDRSFV